MMFSIVGKPMLGISRVLSIVGNSSANQNIFQNKSVIKIMNMKMMIYSFK